MDKSFHLVIYSRDHHSSDRGSVNEDGEKGMCSRDTVAIKWEGFSER